jgi:type I restriction enzyme S subunit
VIYNSENFPELPHSWTSLSVDDSVDSAGNSNKKLKSKDSLEHGRFPVIDQGQSDISGYSDDENLVVEASESNPVILFGDHTRLLKQISQPFVPGADGTKLFRAKSFWDARFIYQMLRAVKLPDKGYARHFQYLRDSVLPLPPLPEQKRIADKLDAVLARVVACRDHLDRIPTILKRFRQSVLAAATSGKLTEDWRTEQLARAQPQTESRNIARDSAQLHYTVTSAPDSDSVNLCYKVSDSPDHVGSLPDDWQWVAVGDLATKVADGVHKKPNYVAAGVPFLTVRNMTAGTGLDFSSTSFVTQADHDEFCKRTHPERGDILLSKDGTLGVVRLVDTDRVFSIFVSVALIKLRDKRMSRYMRIAMESPVLQKQMVGVGTGLQHIHLRDLRQDVVPVPPLEEQTEIVRRVESLFAYADHLEARHTAARAQVEKLTPATLAKAFRGELVPQDPNDEPASELLERIKEQRSGQAENTPKRSRKVTA